jgi:hypothetical protein
VFACQVALVTLSVAVLGHALAGGVTLQLDFNGDLYLAGTRILHDVNPYQPRTLAAEAALIRAGGTLQTTSFPRHPAPVLVAAVPLSLLPRVAADIVFLAASLVAVILGLWMVGVRDWRCIAVAVVSAPAAWGVLLGNLSPLLMLGGACAWRWRAHVWRPAAVVAAMILSKVFVWPLAVWLLATRRLRAVAALALLAVVGAIAGWAVISFDGLTDYPQMLLNIATIGERRGCSLVAVLMSVGLPAEAARIGALACAGALLALAAKVARRPDGDRHAFGLAVMACLTATPIVWAHYLVLLYLPIALLSPRLSGLWFVPMIAGIMYPGPAPHSEVISALPSLAVELVIIVRLCAPLRRSHSALLDSDAGGGQARDAGRPAVVGACTRD